ncbi:MAG: hypothetical protein ACOCP8_02285 [archaeon]
MKNKGYNLTKLPNEGVNDEVPKWMNGLFEKKVTVSKKENPLKGVKNIFATSNKEVSICSICGTPLKKDEVDICINCM